MVRRDATSGAVRASVERTLYADLVRSARLAKEHIERTVGRRGIQSLVGLDAGFDLAIQPRALRAFVFAQSGADIGFDAGDEAFSSMLALKLLGDRLAGRALHQLVAVVGRQSWRGRYRFFCEENNFAADTDCTAVAAASLYETGWLAPEALHASAAQILAAAAPEDLPAAANLDPMTGESDGDLHARVVMVYWNDGQEPGIAPRGRKHDAAVAANALYALEVATAEVSLADRSGVIESTRAYVYDHLRSGAYLRGTRYYPSPDAFLYYVSCLCWRFPAYREELQVDLQEALALRASCTPNPGSPTDPWGLLNQALRAIAASYVDLAPEVEGLLQSQRDDGSWPAAPLYSLGKRACYFGSSAVTTLFAVKAIEESLRGVESQWAGPYASP